MIADGYQKRFCEYLLLQGTDIMVTQITGDTCPCTTWRDGSYSPEYHSEINTTVEDCQGTLLINRTTTTFTLKGIVSLGIQSLNTFMTKEILSEIGELQNEDLLLFGQCKASDGSFFDLTVLSEQRDTLTIDSIDYIRRHSFMVNFGKDIGQISLLKRK